MKSISEALNQYSPKISVIKDIEAISEHYVSAFSFMKKKRTTSEFHQRKPMS